MPKSHELLHRISGSGLSIEYKFTRTISVFSPKMTSIELLLVNSGDAPLSNIKLSDTVWKQFFSGDGGGGGVKRRGFFLVSSVIFSWQSFVYLFSPPAPPFFFFLSQAIGTT